ncbi:hypothetical protein A374_17049 [Fictibacillus macauensis ZFHKF-1]|uniref:Type II toxin-antitoxin system PemK/MazF family toxin n=1 Tax=Fictibacillus macauensis ZFHKF-1 TaxID=1196324 RepID=I8UB04_9BACL|nr:type II toxin-antitoxin system PemK/MazF family toxin [Fictibacillus macauensis]EIT84110.1 hypothetical protein A374_17049 [Fictibacillus macauensis ZFHKF-1]
MIQIGELYSVYFPYPPGEVDEQGRVGKKRPALVIAVDAEKVIAVAVKITSKERNRSYSDRVKIEDWRQTGLRRESWAVVSSLLPLELDPDLNTELHKIGNLTNRDFQRVYRVFTQWHRL